jgi:serine phosphatase RsbU (regulator of sigma subunit)
LAERLETAVRALEWGVASRAIPGEKNSGDQYVVRALQHETLVGVIDALGHGSEAAAAAGQAMATIERYAHEPLPSIIQRCHADLIGTRGVVMSLASFRPADHSMMWLGVGNVEGVLVSADPLGRPTSTTLISRPGIVGGDLSKTNARTVPLKRGDTLLFSTDGIRPGAAAGIPSSETAQEIADRILSLFAKETDDALVLVVRYVGDR